MDTHQLRTFSELNLSLFNQRMTSVFVILEKSFFKNSVLKKSEHSIVTKSLTKTEPPCSNASF